MNVNSTLTQFQLNNNGDFRKNTIDLPSTNLSFASGDVTPFDGNEVVPTASFGSGLMVSMSLDPLATGSNIFGDPLSDEFVINGNFEFTTTTTPTQYRARQGEWTKYEEREVYDNQYKKPFTFTLIPYRNNVKSLTNIDIESIELQIVRSPGTTQEYVYTSIEIERNPYGFSSQYSLNNNQIKLTPDSVYLEKRIITDLLGKDYKNHNNRQEFAYLIGGGYTPKLGSTDNRIEGVQAIAVIYKWKINFKVKELRQGDGVKFTGEGDWLFSHNNSQIGWRTGAHTKDFFHHHNGRGGVGTFSVNTNTRSDHSWAGTFNPDVVTLNSDVTEYNTYPVLKLEVTSPLSGEDQNANGAVGPFWRKVPGKNDMLYMSSSILNFAYGTFDENGKNTNGQYYVQAKLPYEGDSNVVFPSTQEPDFIDFDAVQDPWSLEIGDEIRFENNENKVFTITSLDGRQAIKIPGDVTSENISEKLQVVVTPQLPSTFNGDFFVVRRYKENRNFVILDQQTPYGFPTTGSLEPSSSPGILLPEHRIEKYDRNPDEVLKELIEKRII